MRLLVLVLSLLFMSFAFGEEGGKEEETGPKYIEMTPKFTVNLAEPKKFLLVNVQLLVEGPEAIEAVKKNMPALRHALIMLYSGKPSAELQTMEQREALRQETNTVISDTLEKMEGGFGHGSAKKKGKSKHGDGFQEAYFTEFLID